MYPSEALAKGVEGTVVVQVRLDSKGEVIDAAVLSGPDELRKGVQQSVLNWHFDKSAGSATRVVNIDFVKPPTAPAATSAAFTRAQTAGSAPATAATDDSVQRAKAALQNANNQVTAAGTASADQLAQLRATQSNAQQAYNQQLQQMTQKSLEQLAQQQQAAASTPRQIGSIAVIGLSDSAREQLLAQLPVHTGDAWTPDLALRTREAVMAFDSHLTSTVLTMPDGSEDLRIMLQQPSVFGSPGGSTPKPMLSNVPPGALTVAGNVQAANLISSTKPTYPPLAKMARQQGTVSFQATIGKDGTIENLTVLSGPPLLIPAALDAVKTWTYNPTLLNGSPVEVVTIIDVNFTLSQ
jgi:TonB family protein